MAHPTINGFVCLLSTDLNVDVVKAKIEFCYYWFIQYLCDGTVRDKSTSGYAVIQHEDRMFVFLKFENTKTITNYESFKTLIEHIHYSVPGITIEVGYKYDSDNNDWAKLYEFRGFYDLVVDGEVTVLNGNTLDDEIFAIECETNCDLNYFEVFKIDGDILDDDEIFITYNLLSDPDFNTLEKEDEFEQAITEWLY
uniref:Uncharacterized protein n=1 Tax=Plectus sambesii TaxID=2011161 RepID=A0A914WYE8_9BILA